MKLLEEINIIIVATTITKKPKNKAFLVPLTKLILKPYKNPNNVIKEVELIKIAGKYGISNALLTNSIIYLNHSHF